MRLTSVLLVLAGFMAAGVALPARATGAAASAVVTTERVRAELLAHAPQGVAPGQTVWVGLQIRHQPQWHTYWKNAGDSGLPTTLQWTLPAGLTAGDIAWPLPQQPLAQGGGHHRGPGLGLTPQNRAPRAACWQIFSRFW